MVFVSRKIFNVYSNLTSRHRTHGERTYLAFLRTASLTPRRRVLNIFIFFKISETLKPQRRSELNENNGNHETYLENSICII